MFDSKCPGTIEGRIKDGNISIVRFDGDNGEYRLFLGKAKTAGGFYTRGTYIWIEADDWVKWERTLVEGPYVHHCAGIHADVIPVLYEAAKYIPGLELDIMGTTEDAILDYLNGK